MTTVHHVLLLGATGRTGGRVLGRCSTAVCPCA